MAAVLGAEVVADGSKLFYGVVNIFFGVYFSKTKADAAVQFIFAKSYGNEGGGWFCCAYTTGCAAADVNPGFI